MTATVSEKRVLTAPSLCGRGGHNAACASGL